MSTQAFPNKRKISRIHSNLPIQLSFGSQITLEGYLKDVSLKSAFIKLKSSIFLQPNDELTFRIQRPAQDDKDRIEGSARISRIAKGEGIAIYFTKMDEGSTSRLKELIGV